MFIYSGLVQLWLPSERLKSGKFDGKPLDFGIKNKKFHINLHVLLQKMYLFGEVVALRKPEYNTFLKTISQHITIPDFCLMCCYLNTIEGYSTLMAVYCNSDVHIAFLSIYLPYISTCSKYTNK